MEETSIGFMSMVIKNWEWILLGLYVVEKAIKLGKRIVAQLGNTKHKFIHQQKDYSHLLF